MKLDLDNKKLDLDKFKLWLESNGGTVLPKTNPFELVRFKGSEVGVVYTTGKFSGEYAKNTLDCFKKGKKWDGRPINYGRSSSYRKEKINLIKRDGTCCFLCGKELEDDVTVEHLVPLVAGGKNDISNMALTHYACNNELSTKSVFEKVKMAIERRSNLQPLS